MCRNNCSVMWINNALKWFVFCFPSYVFATLHVAIRQLRSFHNWRTEHDINLLLPLSYRRLLEAHGCKHWVTNLSIVLHTLGIPTANITYFIISLEYVNESQVNVRVLYMHCSYGDSARVLNSNSSPAYNLTTSNYAHDPVVGTKL